MKLRMGNSLPPSGDGWQRNGRFGFGSFLLLKWKREKNITYTIWGNLRMNWTVSTLKETLSGQWVNGLNFQRARTRQNPSAMPAPSTVFSNSSYKYPGLGSRLSTYWPTKHPNKWQCSEHTSADQTPIPCVLWIKTQRGVGCEERTLRRSHTGLASLAWAATPINGATPGLRTSVCY